MNKELFNKFRELNLPIGEYAIFGSGPMGIRDLKKCNDLDVIVSPRIFDNYKQNPDWHFDATKGWGFGLVLQDEIEMLKEWGPGKWDVAELIKNAEIIDGLAFVKLEEVLKWKKVMDREKDKKDIEIIENYLRING